MAIPRRIPHTLTAAILMVASSLTQASGTGSFVFTPSAAPVPALSDGFLVVLGLLLVVIAFRTLKGNRGYQKFLSLAVLCGGLLIGGLGAERTAAIILEEFVTGEGGLSCEQASGASFNPYHNGNSIVTNGCDRPGTVKATLTGGGCTENPGTCGQLGVGEQCVLPYFESCG